jgi:hypothetical protein
MIAYVKHGGGDAMNWDAIGAIGEIVGAAAVVATLIYLAVQVRSARTATDANLVDRARDNAFECDRLLLEYAELWVRANAGVELSADDDLRVDRIVRMLSSDSFHAYRRSATLRSGRERVHSMRLAEFLYQHPFAYRRWQAIQERSISTNRLLVGDWTAKGINQKWERDVTEGVVILNREDRQPA